MNSETNIHLRPDANVVSVYTSAQGKTRWLTVEYAGHEITIYGTAEQINQLIERTAALRQVPA